MALDGYAIESMAYMTTGMIDRKDPDCYVEAAMCKVYGSEASWRTVNECIQVRARGAGGQGEGWKGTGGGKGNRGGNRGRLGRRLSTTSSAARRRLLEHARSSARLVWDMLVVWPDTRALFLFDWADHGRPGLHDGLAVRARHARLAHSVHL